jgi:hypothetical protein
MKIPAERLYSVAEKIFSETPVQIGEEKKVKMFNRGAYLAGGAIVNTLLGSEPNDYDIFFRDKDLALDFARAAVRGLPVTASVVQVNDKVDRVVLEANFSTINRILKADKKNELSFVSNTALSYKNKLQVITAFIGEPEDVFKFFDYEHCKVYMDFNIVEEKFVVGDEQTISAILTKDLIYTGGSKYILSALMRSQKFAKRGWSMKLSSALRLSKGLGEIDLTNKKELKEQLISFYGLSDAADDLLNQATRLDDFSSIDFDKLITVLEGVYK